MNGWHFMDEDDQLGVQQVQQSSEDVGPPITMVEAPNRDVASHNKEVSSQGDPLGHLVQEVLQPPPSEVDTSADTALAAVGYNPREWNQYSVVTTDGDLSDPSISNSTNDPLEPTYEEVSPPPEGEIPEARGDEVKILQKQLQEEKDKIIKAQKIIQELRGELQFQMNTLRREIHKKENAFSQVTTAHFCLELEEMSNRQHVEMINFVKRKHGVLTAEIGRLKAINDSTTPIDRCAALITASYNF
jgi:hypothetical protein